MMIRIRNRRTVTRSIIALFLTLCMFGIGPMQELSADGVKAATEEPAKEKKDEFYPEGTLFIKELRYFHGKKGREQAESEGWILHDTDLNSGNDGGELWLAYKTTTDRSEAITALKTMEMKGGYEITNYRKIMESVSQGLSDTAGALLTVAAEFRENLEQGFIAPSASKGLLNLFTLQEGGVKEGETFDTERLLGNYLASGNYKSEDIQELIMQINPTMLATIFTRLAGGVFFREVNFAERVPGMAEKIGKLSSQGLSTLDTRYQSTVLELKEKLQMFSKEVREAQARAMSNGGKILLSDGTSVEVDVDASGSEGSSVENVGVDDIKDVVDETVEKGGVSDKGKQGEEDLAILSQLNVLNRYDFDGNTKLGNKLVELGELQFTKKSEVRQVYPFVMAMTPGQASVVRLCGVTVMVEGLLENDEIYKKLESDTEELKTKLKEKGFVAAPVWSVEDKAFYEGNIAYTKKLLRAQAAGSNFTDVTKTTALGKFWNSFDAAAGVISALSGAVYSIGAYCIGIAKPLKVIAWGASLVSKVWTTGLTAGIIKGAAGVVIGVIGLVGLAILAITLLVYIGKKIYHALYEWDEMDYEESDIPIYLLDADETESGEMANIRYYLVTDPDTNRGDLNCGEGKRWNALYYTRSEAAGDPICAADENDFFASAFGTPGEKPAGIEGVCSFSSSSTQSINAYAKDKDNGHHYLYYRTSLNGELGEIAKGREEKSNGEYLADVRIFTAKTETEAKASLAREGYKLYDTNVSPKGDKGRQYSYIGYKVTNKKTAAVRDIRVCLGYPGTSLKIGDISYSPGQSEDEHTASNAFLCHTSSKDYGSPICWKNVFFVNKMADAKPGWEPVSLTCGGPAFDWHSSNEGITVWDKEYWEVKDEMEAGGLYMYYKPDEVYTEGEEYLSGIQFVSGGFYQDGGSNPSLEDYMAEMGATPVIQLAENLGGENGRMLTIDKSGIRGGDDLTDGKWDGYDIWLAYTTTHNPYRALTDVKYYRSSYATNGLTPHLNVTGYGYVACENYQYLNYTKLGKVERTFAPSHAYLGPDIDGSSAETGIKIELQYFDEMKSKDTLMEYRGMYVCGYSKSKTLLKPSDVEFIDDDTDPSPGFGPMGEFLNSYDYGFRNIAYTPGDHGFHAFAYMRGRPTSGRPKYVKNICGTYFETPRQYEKEGEEVMLLNGTQMKAYDAMAPEQCRMQAIQMGAEEIITQNYTNNKAKKKEDDGVIQYFAYIGVSRTDKDTEALRGAIKFEQSFTDTAGRGADTVKVGGVKYTLSGTNMRDPLGKVFSLYTTTQTGAGSPVAEIKMDDQPFATDMDTMLAASTVDMGSGAKQVFAPTGLTENEHRFIHLQRSESEKTFFSRIVVADSSHNSDREAQCKLLSAGCNRCIPLDVNAAPLSVAMIGARTCGPDSPDIAIRDILCTVGEKPVESFERDGFEYKLAGDVSLNAEYMANEKIYVYYTHGAKLVGADEYAELIGDATEPDNTPVSTEDDLDDWLLDDNDSDEDEMKILYMKQAPVTQLAAGVGDFLPKTIPGVVWERILDTNGRPACANQGVVYNLRDTTTPKDSRVFLYTAHEDGGVKPGATVTEVDGKYQMGVGVLWLCGTGNTKR